jgi:hypothetical protein
MTSLDLGDRPLQRDPIVLHNSVDLVEGFYKGDRRWHRRRLELPIELAHLSDNFVVVPPCRVWLDRELVGDHIARCSNRVALSPQVSYSKPQIILVNSWTSRTPPSDRFSEETRHLVHNLSAPLASVAWDQSPVFAPESTRNSLSLLRPSPPPDKLIDAFPLLVPEGV